eukprot:2117062-Rhodomonas_salina.2
MDTMTHAEGREGVMEVLENAWGGRVWSGEGGSVRMPEEGEEVVEREKWSTAAIMDPEAQES